MRFGLGPYELGADDGKPQVEVYEQMLEEATQAEELGFDSIWLAESHFTPDGGCSSAEAAAAAVAVRTQAARIGVFSTVTLTHPLYVAEDVAVLDNIAGGRVIVAAQPGRPEEIAAYGIDPKVVNERFVEALRVMLKAWAPASFAYEGKFWKLPKKDYVGNPFAEGVTEINVTPKPAQLNVPLWVHARDHADVERAARLGFPIVGSPFDTAAELKAKRDLYERAAAAAGRLTDGQIYPAIREVYVSETMEEARADTEEHLLSLYRAYHKRGVLVDAPGDFAALARDRFIVGDVDHVCAEIDRYQRSVGVNYLICRMSFPGMNASTAMAGIRFFGTAVIPEFRMASFPREIRRRTRLSGS
jgi:alkanesulfonate monooxygenase SsuD/methylene tetrahydromethanopterin reductase-like flavin-dependent oxidoreductase (luciferase family)